MEENVSGCFFSEHSVERLLCDSLILFICNTAADPLSRPVV